ncbi:MAG: class I SAM-dependent rRNA methyltransferase [Oscillospiraceae bacterium]|nr:class I SAM-dependent rRNA methyltransferase [Oscillospiraceae bacterium]
MRMYPVFTVTKKAETSIRAGHKWVYGEEVISVEGAYENGSVADVVSKSGKWLGAGFINDRSKLRVRLLSRNPNDRFDEAFWRRRVKYAVDYRRKAMGGQFDCCRLIFGEADGIPGLTADRFSDVIVSEVLCFGTESVKEIIYDELIKQTGCGVIYERNDNALRDKEGLERGCGFAYGEGNGHVIITENGLKFDVDYIEGQKTGFFLDQKYNRAAVARFARGMRVLDCFTHTGAFALNCAAAGAREVTAVDSSAPALETAKRSAALNGIESVGFVRADVFDFLSSAQREYDLIILDPPAFTKSSSTVKAAARGYKEINFRAMKLLHRGGFLATCSCSHFMTDAVFRQVVSEAAADADVSLRQAAAGQQAPDHPVLWGVPETEYLKFYIFQVV